MSWDIVLFNSRQVITSIEKLDPDQLEAVDFDGILISAFDEVIHDGTHCEIKGKDYSIDFFLHNERVSNTVLNLYGENALFELIELAKRQGWQMYDTALDSMIDLDNPAINGYANHRKYVEKIRKH